MSVLLDECVPRKLKNYLAGHDCQTVPEAGFAGRKNGESLSFAERVGFEGFLTIDQGFEYEQNLLGRRIAIVIVRVRTSRMADLLPLVPDILRSLVSLRSGQLVRVGE